MTNRWKQADVTLDSKIWRQIVSLSVSLKNKEFSDNFAKLLI